VDLISSGFSSSYYMFLPHPIYQSSSDLHTHTHTHTHTPLFISYPGDSDHKARPQD